MVGRSNCVGMKTAVSDAASARAVFLSLSAHGELLLQGLLLLLLLLELKLLAEMVLFLDGHGRRCCVVAVETSCRRCVG